MQNFEKMEQKAHEAAEFLKCLGSPHRLMVLCQLAEGEKSVTELTKATGASQTSMSQHLSKLKAEGLIDFRREHRTLYYKISNPAVIGIMDALFEIFCKERPLCHQNTTPQKG